MKKITRIVFVLCLITMGALFSPEKSSAQDVDVQIFYDQLSPYGSWVNDPNYGYVWVPQADPNFTPYGTAGHWEWSDDGWLWVSDYPWGWAPFHYGRWNYDYNYGWMWIPGTTWGPAWVEWRSSPGYYGWCALGPGIGINGYASYNPPADRWLFVRDKYINSPRVTQYYERRENNARIFGQTRVIDNRHVDNSRHATYIAGPRREDVQKATGTQIRPVAIRDNAKPGQSVGHGEVSIYRPAVRKTVANAPKPAPRQVAPTRDLKPIPGGHSQPQVKQPDNKRPDVAPNQPQRQQQATPHANTPQPQKQQHEQPKAAPHVNNPQPQSQPRQQATPKPQQQKPQAAPHTSNPQPQRQQPQQTAPRVNKPQHSQPQQQAPRAQPQQRPAPQARPTPQPNPQPPPQARPAEQPHQEQPQPRQEEPRPR